MPARIDCPPNDVWRTLFEDKLPAEEREGYERHLEDCPACQDRLDRADELPGVLRRLGSKITDATPAPDATLVSFLERVFQAGITDQPGPAEPDDLFFLGPADEPGVLGTLGGYQVREMIGRGGMGIVLKAFEPALHRHVAIKVMSPYLAGSATARRRFTREAQAAAAVCHDHVVAVHGVSEVGGLPYLVMQYVAGGSLQDRLDRAGPLEVVEIVRVAMQTAQGLAAAHAQGLIHRDVKPANLLLEDGLARVKITDFGLARLVDDVALTQTGVVAGTPQYMAPEQARGEVVDHRSDLFSLGGVMYAMSTGLAPFRGASALVVLRKVNEQEVRPVRWVNPDVPEWLETVVMRLLAKNPEDRFQSAQEVAALLEAYLAHLQQPTSVPAPALPAAPAVERRRVPALVWASALVALLGVAAGITAWLNGGGPPGPEALAPDAKKPPARTRTVIDFRKGLEKYPSLSLSGGVADAEMKADSAGLRVLQPAGRGDTRPVLLELAQRLSGDFDIALRYELLAVGGPVPQYGAGVAMRVWLDAPSSPSILLSRFVKPNGERYGAHWVVKGSDDKEKYLNNKDAPAASRKGRLRLTRTGGQVEYLVAEDAREFKKLQTVRIGTADVQRVQLFCHTMHAPIALDVRLGELVVEAEQAQDVVPISAPRPVGDTTEPEPRPKGQLAGVVLLGLLAPAACVAGAWLYLRTRREERAPVTEKKSEEPQAGSSPVAAQCPGCGTRIKARGGLAGKTVRCPQCAGAVRLPEGR